MMRNKYLIIGFVIISLVTLVYIIMLIDTNDLMKEVKSVFLGKVPYSETKGKPISRYNTSSYSGTKISLSLIRLFNFHNFSDGTIYIYYTVVVYDRDGEILYGSWRIPAKWKIHKENGQWLITDIIEDP
jgi:hypothetical protein